MAAFASLSNKGKVWRAATVPPARWAKIVITLEIAAMMKSSHFSMHNFAIEESQCARDSVVKVILRNGQ
jgi:hypothetical protein